MPLDKWPDTLRIFTGTQLACVNATTTRTIDGRADSSSRWRPTQTISKTNNRDDLFTPFMDAKRRPPTKICRRSRSTSATRFMPTKCCGTSNGKINLPVDYQYDDAKGGEAVAAHPIFGPMEIPGSENQADYPSALGDWLTSPDNPRFTQVIANRLWKRAMRHGLVEPVDDWRDDKPTHPELLRLSYAANRRICVTTCGPICRCSSTRRPTNAALIRRSRRRRSNFLPRPIVGSHDRGASLGFADDANCARCRQARSGFFDTQIYYGGQPVLVGKEDMYSRNEAVKDHDVDQHWTFLTAELKAMQDDFESQKESGTIPPDDVGRGFYRRPRSDGVLVRASELRSPAEPSQLSAHVWAIES